MAEPRNLLILGGTGEAAALSHRLIDDPDVAVTVSLAGRTREPKALPGRVRRGGFGGVEGLTRYLRDQRIDLVIDATHPYAARISHNAAAACAALGVAHLRLDRPPWVAQRGDRWLAVPDAAGAAALLPDIGRRVFLAIGRQELAPFAALSDFWFLVRSVDPPEAPLPLDRYELVVARGPFGQEAEAELLRDYGIAVLVSKNSGGTATYGKIAAAREIGLPVVLIARPPAPAGESVGSVDAALAWLRARC